MNKATTIVDAVARRAETHPTSPALVIADGQTLGYGELSAQIDVIADGLVDLGVGPVDTIGIALSDGPEMAIAFLGTSAVAAAAPLNPSYREAEFEFEIEDLDLSAMVVGVGASEVTPAVEAARRKDIPVYRISSNTLDGFSLELAGPPTETGPQRRRNDVNDVALVLHTSGTTARPKIVPLRHANLAASAAAIGDTLRLTDQDRVLCVMPLFHIHGLIAGLCASLANGATVICTPGFSAAEVPAWLRRHRATWYTAVPTMHQALLERSRTHPGDFDGVSLRFIRSSSSSLAPTVMAGLEEAFGCPVVEAYGMTEAAHQMACNPLPPSRREAGSVGPAAGPKVAIMDAAGATLGIDQVGEVVIKGPSVMPGYHANPQANSAAFVDGWFRTGDQGRIDAHGYLTLTGRLKEIINRGGEKVSPREVDEVLLDHPSIAQVVTFAVPDHRLGEQVAAAVVLDADGADVCERHIREYAAAWLAPFKVPRTIVFLDAIPKGPSGKLQRIGLADKLGLADLDAGPTAVTYVAPSLPAELLVAELWHEVLGRSEVGVHEHFLDAGGDSLGAARLLTRVRDEIDVELSMIDFFDAPTIAEQARLVEALLLQSVEENAVP